MASKLHGDGLYVGSRFILPQHREAYIQMNEQKQLRTKPVLDEQELQLIQQGIAGAFHSKMTVQITVFNPSEDKQLQGTISAINLAAGQFKIVTGEDSWEWISFNQILRVSKE